MHKMYYFYISLALLAILPVLSLAKDKEQYNFDGINKLSINEVNAIMFAAPIAQVNYPAGQMLVNAGGNGAITYTQDRKTIIFLLNKKLKPKTPIQFMVSLKDGQLFSLHFIAVDKLGQIIEVSKHVKQNAVDQKLLRLENTEGYADENKSSKSTTVEQLNYNYTQALDALPKISLIESLMHRVLILGNPGKDWQVWRFTSPQPLYYPKIEQHIVAAWKKDHYHLSEWKICSQREKPLTLTLRKTNGQGRMSTFLGFHTVSNVKLQVGNCVYLLVLNDMTIKARPQETIRPLPNVLSPYRPPLTVVTGVQYERF